MMATSTIALVLAVVGVAACAPKMKPLTPGWIISSPDCLKWEIVLVSGIDMQTGEPRQLQIVHCAERKQP